MTASAHFQGLALENQNRQNRAKEIEAAIRC